MTSGEPPDAGSSNLSHTNGCVPIRRCGLEGLLKHFAASGERERRGRRATVKKAKGKCLRGDHLTPDGSQNCIPFLRQKLFSLLVETCKRTYVDTSSWLSTTVTQSWDCEIRATSVRMFRE